MSTELKGIAWMQVTRGFLREIADSRLMFLVSGRGARVQALVALIITSAMMP